MDETQKITENENGSEVSDAVSANQKDIGVLKQKEQNVKTKRSIFTRNKNQKSNSKIPVVPRKKNIWIKDILLAVVNIFLIFGLVYLLNRIPQRANQIKALRSQSILNVGADDVNVQRFEYDNNKESFEKLKKAYPNDDGLISFVSDIEKLKVEGSVVGFTFASKDPVADKTKNFGLPIIILLSGSWEQISVDIEKIQNLPYAFRPVTFDAEEIPEEGIVEVKYGGFLYVDKSLEKN